MPTRRVVVDHLTIGVADLDRSVAFYVAALAPLGMGVLNDRRPDVQDVAFGPEGIDDFVVSAEHAVGRNHVAFAADSRAEVDAFHAAALAAGGTDNGVPGIRTAYSPGYYGSFVLDPDGHNIEAVFHEPA